MKLEEKLTETLLPRLAFLNLKKYKETSSLQNQTNKVKRKSMQQLIIEE